MRISPARAGGAGGPSRAPASTRRSTAPAPPARLASTLITPNAPRRSSASPRTLAGSGSSPSPVVVLFVTVYWFYELGRSGHRRHRRLDAETNAQQVTDGGDGLQPVRGQLRALPRGAGPRRDRPGAQRPGRSCSPTSTPHYIRSVLNVGWPLRVRQSQQRSCRSGRTRRTAGSAQLRADRRPDRVHPGAQRPDVHRPRSVVDEPKMDPITGKVETFKGWVDPTYKPAAGATPFPDCWTDEFASASAAPGRLAGPGSDPVAPKRPDRLDRGPEHRVHDDGRHGAGRHAVRHRLRQPGRRDAA